MKNDKYWTEYWKYDGSSGEVFVDKKGEKPEYLANFWKNKLKNIKQGCSILDVACGAGSIFQELPSSHGCMLYGADISPEALKQIKKNITGVSTLNCKSDEISLKSNSIDVVVSQFGVEYSGEKGFLDAIRVLKSNGLFIFIAHFQGGYIDSRNQQQLKGAELVHELSFISKAVSVSNALYFGNQHEFECEFEPFSEAESILYKYCQEFPEGIHAHLYNGFRQLLTNREKYNFEDIKGWLIDMEEEVEINLIRLKSMCKAALSRQEVEELKKKLLLNKVDNFDFSPFYGNSDLPIAWHISGNKR